MIGTTDNFIDRLERDILTLREALLMTPEKVERAAIAMWDAESVRAQGKKRRIPWRDENPQIRENWRSNARACLMAAGMKIPA